MDESVQERGARIERTTTAVVRELGRRLQWAAGMEAICLAGGIFLAGLAGTMLLGVVGMLEIRLGQHRGADSGVSTRREPGRASARGRMRHRRLRDRLAVAADIITVASVAATLGAIALQVVTSLFGL